MIRFSVYWLILFLDVFRKALTAVTAFVRVPGFDDEEYINSHYLLFCSKQGIVKKTVLEAYSRPRQNGVIAIFVE